jgi:hypothetical protein
VVDDLGNLTVDIIGLQRMVIVLALVAIPGLCESVGGSEADHVEAQISGPGISPDRVIISLSFVK